MTTPRIRGASARDLARAMTKFMAEYGWIDDEDAESETLGHYIAAALAERERAAVERCCAALCDRCNSGVPVEVIVRSGVVSYWHKENDQWSGGQCKAFLIRAEGETA